MAIGRFITADGVVCRWVRSDGSLGCQIPHERYSTRVDLGVMTWGGETYDLILAIKGTAAAPEALKLFRLQELQADGTLQELGDEFTARLALLCYMAGAGSAPSSSWTTIASTTRRPPGGR